MMLQVTISAGGDEEGDGAGGGAGGGPGELPSGMAPPPHVSIQSGRDQMLQFS